MFVKFLQHRKVHDHVGRVEQSFDAGQVVELSETSAQRWLRRGIAVLVDAPRPLQVIDATAVDADRGLLPRASRRRTRKEKPSPENKALGAADEDKQSELLDGSDDLEG